MHGAQRQWRIERLCTVALTGAALAAVPAAAHAAVETTITAAPPLRVATGTVSYAFAADAPGAAFTCSLDYAPPVACSSPETFLGLTDGTHTLLVAADGDDTPATARVIVDTVAPDTVITAPPPARTNAPALTIEFAASESGVSLCSLDGAAPAPCVSPITYPTVALGPHTFSVAAQDLVGNLDATPATASWTVAPVALLGPVRVRASARGRVTVTVGPLAEAASAQVVLRRNGVLAARARRVTARAPGRTSIAIALSMATRRALARHGELRLRVTVTLDSGATAARTLTVVSPARAKKKGAPGGTP